MNIRALLFITGISLTTPIFAQVCNSAIPVSTPSADFIDHGDGTVTHVKTGLMWKKCAEGQTLSVQTGACTGNSVNYDWQGMLKHAKGVNAKSFAGYKDWRVPNVRELTSIIEDKCVDPAINLKVFPDTSNDRFWSASGDVNDDSFISTISFKDGSYANSLKIQTSPARLVRGGRIR